MRRLITKHQKEADKPLDFFERKSCKALQTRLFRIICRYGLASSKSPLSQRGQVALRDSYRNRRSCKQIFGQTHVGMTHLVRVGWRLRLPQAPTEARRHSSPSHAQARRLAAVAEWGQHTTPPRRVITPVTRIGRQNTFNDVPFY
ncbi:hypothetical protein EVAR_66064_1 [Eumeta japonica]|uniref:Uncharacterized protein n=1 Tax=Eumeta variegata TaxID=151549 RepID=A0A4C1ZJ34_EUMVA|nr:hypothetical protein EVAR_66064_1 [Eumeta japonica]